MDMLFNISAHLVYFIHVLGGSVSKESACCAVDCLQFRRPGFHPWVGKILASKPPAHDGVYFLIAYPCLATSYSPPLTGKH